MAAKVGMNSATHESVTVPVSRDRKISTALKTNQITGFVTVPSKKKKMKDNTTHIFSSFQVIPEFAFFYGGFWMEN